MINKDEINPQTSLHVCHIVKISRVCPSFFSMDEGLQEKHKETILKFVKMYMFERMIVNILLFRLKKNLYILIITKVNYKIINKLQIGYLGNLKLFCFIFYSTILIRF